MISPAALMTFEGKEKQQGGEEEGEEVWRTGRNYSNGTRAGAPSPDAAPEKDRWHSVHVVPPVQKPTSGSLRTRMSPGRQAFVS